MEYAAQNSPSVDPFLKPHELDRAPSKLVEEIPIDPTIPEIANWNTDDVFDYFKQHLPEAAPILKEQVKKTTNKSVFIKKYKIYT